MTPPTQPIPPTGPAHAAPKAKTPILTRLKKYRKTVVAATGLGLTFASTFFPDNKYTIAAIAIATAFGVWRVPNTTKPQTTTLHGESLCRAEITLRGLRKSSVRCSQRLA